MQPGAIARIRHEDGQVKRTELKEYMTTRSTAIAACKLADGDEVIARAARATVRRNSARDASWHEHPVRRKRSKPNGPVAGGVRGMQLKEDDEVIAAEWVGRG